MLGPFGSVWRPKLGSRLMPPYTMESIAVTVSASIGLIDGSEHAVGAQRCHREAAELRHAAWALQHRRGGEMLEDVLASQLPKRSARPEPGAGASVDGDESKPPGVLHRRMDEVTVLQIVVSDRTLMVGVNVAVGRLRSEGHILDFSEGALGLDSIP